MTIEKIKQNFWSIILVLGIVLLSRSSLVLLHSDMLNHEALRARLRYRTLAQTFRD